jgi:hypothetical protein
MVTQTEAVKDVLGFPGMGGYREEDRIMREKERKCHFKTCVTESRLVSKGI